MVVAPWILPLRVAVFASLIGQARLLSRSLITLVAGAGMTLILSMGLGLIAPTQGLLVVEALHRHRYLKMNRKMKKETRPKLKSVQSQIA